MLTEFERENPFPTIKDLTTDYTFDELHEFISMMVEVCLTTENLEFSDPIDRSDLLTQARILLMMLKIGYMLVGPKAKEKQ